MTPLPVSDKEGEEKEAEANCVEGLHKWYNSHKCCDNDHDGIKAIDLPAFEGIEELIRSIYEGIIKAGQTASDLVLYTANTLWSAVKDQFRGQVLNFDTSEAEWLHLQQNNLYAFSAAKSFAQLKEMRNLVFDTSGTIRPFSEFRSDALAIHNRYNVAWLETEYNSVVQGTIAAKKWLQIQRDKDLFPYLRYDTVGDSRVRPEHQRLNGLILPVDHPFWRLGYPPNGFNCRCFVTQLREAELSSDDLKRIERDKESAIDTFFEAVPDRFWHRNVGTSEIFERNGVAYFRQMPVSENELKAVRHYRLQSVTKVYNQNERLIADTPTPARNLTGYFSSLGNQITDLNGHPVRLITSQQIDRQYARAIELISSNNASMEIWESSKGTRNYLIYYSSKPVVISVVNGALKSVKQVSKVTAETKRKGTLIKR